jgi:large subunit ribosomal protein L4
MVTLKKYDLTGQQVGEVELEDSWVDFETNSQMVKDYIIAIRANARQWSASTQGRSEVNHSNKKPHKQKGTGKARQGSLSAPQYKGGGVVFGPKPKFNQHVRINKKERKAAILFLFAEMIRSEKVHVLQDDALEVPKTKVLVNFLQALKLDKNILFLGDSTEVKVETEGLTKTVSVRSTKHETLVKSIRNIPKVNFMLAKNTNGYALMLAKDLVITEAGLEEIKDWLVG